MLFAKVSNGSIIEYPVSFYDIQKQNPETSFPIDVTPSDVEPFGFVLVNQTQQPSFDYREFKLQEGVPLEKENNWIQTWDLIPLTNEEKKAITEAKEDWVRTERNVKLQDSDWTQLPDAPVDAAAWAIYRQELRDVTAQPGFPWDVQWPQKPQ